MITSRLLTIADFPRLREEISKEPEHKWMTPEFFQLPNTLSTVYEDEDGPIMFVRASSALRLHIQFCDIDKEKIRRCIITQFPELSQKAKRSGYVQVLYESISRPLIWFCRRYLGFSGSPNEQILWLEQLPPTSVESSVCESGQNSPST